MVGMFIDDFMSQVLFDNYTYNNHGKIILLLNECSDKVI